MHFDNLYTQYTPPGVTPLEFRQTMYRTIQGAGYLVQARAGPTLKGRTYIVELVPVGVAYREARPQSREEAKLAIKCVLMGCGELHAHGASYRVFAQAGASVRSDCMCAAQLHMQNNMLVLPPALLHKKPRRILHATKMTHRCNAVSDTPCCCAVAHAGYVHRDVRWPNVIKVFEDGVPTIKLIDLELAGLAGAPCKGHPYPLKYWGGDDGDTVLEEDDTYTFRSDLKMVGKELMCQLSPNLLGDCGLDLQQRLVGGEFVDTARALEHAWFSTS